MSETAEKVEAGAVTGYEALRRAYETPCFESQRGEHRLSLKGRPLSGSTYYECDLCHRRFFRG